MCLGTTASITTVLKKWTLPNDMKSTVHTYTLGYKPTFSITGNYDRGIQRKTGSPEETTVPTIHKCQSVSMPINSRIKKQWAAKRAWNVCAFVDSGVLNFRLSLVSTSTLPIADLPAPVWWRVFLVACCYWTRDDLLPARWSCSHLRRTNKQTDGPNELSIFFWRPSKKCIAFHDNADPLPVIKSLWKGYLPKWEALLRESCAGYVSSTSGKSIHKFGQQQTKKEKVVVGKGSVPKLLGWPKISCTNRASQFI